MGAIDFSRELQRQIGSVTDVLAKERQHKQTMQDTIALLKLKSKLELSAKETEAKIKQKFQSPLDKLVDVAKASKALSDVGIDPRGIFGSIDTGGLNVGGLGAKPTAPTAQSIGAPAVPVTGGAISGQREAVAQPGFPSPRLELEPTKFERTAFGGFQPTEARPKGFKEKEAQLKIQAKRQEEASKAQVNFEKTANLFSGIIAQQKGAEEEQGGLGLLPGLKGSFNVAIKNPEFSRVASAFGQRAETAFALNSVLTGQNRVIRGVINMILGSLPGKFDPAETVAAKTAQSLRNAFMLTRALGQAGLTKNILSKMSQAELNNIDVQSLVAGVKLSPQEDAILEAKINSVLATPPAKKRTLLGERGISKFGRVSGMPTPEEARRELERRRGGR